MRVEHVHNIQAIAQLAVALVWWTLAAFTVGAFAGLALGRRVK